MDVGELIDELIEREGDYVDNPLDRGGPTRFGISEAVARAQGYAGPMRRLPRDEAVAIYKRLYWLRPRLDKIAERSEAIAEELFDTGANMGPAVAITFLQRALSALNRDRKDYADLVPDGRIGPMTLAALDTFLRLRGGGGDGRPHPGQPGASGGRPHPGQPGAADGETILLRALDALQGERYIRLAERRPANEAFLYGWLANRIG